MPDRIEFKVISHKIDGDLHITENSQLNNVEANTVTIAPNITVRIFGTVKTMIVLKQGARLFLHGVLLGNIQNEGGEFHYFSKEA